MKLDTQQYLIETDALSTYFPMKGGFWGQVIGQTKALDQVSLKIPRGKTLALVGESGCGKSTFAKTLLRLLTPTSGRIFFDGEEITHLPAEEMIKIRKKMQIILQDPYASLNPRMTVHQMLSEALCLHGLYTQPQAREERIKSLLASVQLSPEILGKYPSEFSGGQRQRLCTARALAPEPEFILLDEATASLDVSIQAQIINLLITLQEQLGLTYLFISHDLNVVRFMADYVAVMYLGNVVEQGPAQELFAHPRHPYTKALLSAMPQKDPRLRSQRIVLQGDVPSPSRPPTGCHFHPRCWRATEKCKQSLPVLSVQEGKKNHFYRCHHPLEGK